MKKALGKIPLVRSEVVAEAEADVKNGALLTREASEKTAEAFMRSEISEV